MKAGSYRLFNFNQGNGEVTLQEYPYVHLMASDFSKVFDTVRHSTLLEKSAKLPIQDFAHNWLLEFLEDRQHCTKFNGKTSVFLLINASNFNQGNGEVTLQE